MHTLSPVSLSGGPAGGQSFLLLAITCKRDVRALREAGEGQDIRKVLLGGSFVFTRQFDLGGSVWQETQMLGSTFSLICFSFFFFFDSKSQS